MQVFTQTINTTQRILLFIPILLLSLACSAFKTATKSKSTHKKDAVEVQQLRENVSGWAKNYVGIKYHYAGRSPKTGFDCSGFTSFVMKEFDIKVSPSSSTQSTQGIKLPIKDAKPGDLIFFSHGGQSKTIQHVSIVVSNDENGLFVCHATNTRGVIVENVYESNYWNKRLLFARDVITPHSIK
jgi:cell wall-associated NlpC family hydrolase